MSEGPVDALRGFDQLSANLQADYEVVVSQGGWGNAWTSLVQSFIQFELSHVSYF